MVSIYVENSNKFNSMTKYLYNFSQCLFSMFYTNNEPNMAIKFLDTYTEIEYVHVILR